MEIKLTRQEFITLMKMVHITESVLFPYKYAECQQIMEPYEMLGQKIYSYAQEFGLEELIEADQESLTYIPTTKFEEQLAVTDLIEAFEESVFWENLMDRLAERDAIEGLAGESPPDPNLARSAFEDAHAAMAEKYSDEFVKHGIDRLRVQSRRQN